MTEPRTAERRRETRLLLATIAVSVGMLLLLARFRFPEEAARQTVEPAAPPLERLAARATFDELAGIIADLERRILPTLLPVAGQRPDGTLYVPAVRVTADRAVAMLPGDYRIASVGSELKPNVLLHDVVREVAVVAAPPRADGIPSLPATGGRPGPRYVAVVEATGGTLSIRPVYIGRTDLVPDGRWSEPLLAVAAVQQNVSAGSAVFSLDGAFIGLATNRTGTVTIVPAGTLRNVATAAPATAAPRADLRLDVQPLTPLLAKIAGASKGVMVSYVPDPDSPLSSGDVIRSVDGIGVTTVGGFRQVAQSRKPGAQVALEIVRRGEPLTVTVTAAPANGSGPTSSDRDSGAVLRSLSGTGSEVVTVAPGGAADRAGLRRGDVIIAMDDAQRPAPAVIDRWFRAASPGDAVLLTVRRDGEHRIVALEKH
jgi:S1-C subfamily serine protease